MPGDPPRLQGVRVGRFRLDLHDYEEGRATSESGCLLGEKAIEHEKVRGDIKL